MCDIRFLSCGDSAVTVELSRDINEDTNKLIRYISSSLDEKHLKGVIESVPTFCSLTVYFDPFKTSKARLERAIRRIIEDYKPSTINGGRLFHIPVCYDGELSPDMESVCAHTGLTRDEVIALHTSPEYLIYMLGFLPGFAYLGGLDKRLETPRLDTPRTLIPEGSVGIGGKQTGIYPLASPGGWRLIGCTPIRVYTPHSDDPILYKAGDRIKFYPITYDEFVRGECKVRVEEVTP